MHLPLLSRRQFVASGLAAHHRLARVPTVLHQRTRHALQIRQTRPQRFGGQRRIRQRIVHCPFAFRHDNRFYLTFVAFDGAGYQTGLAVSEDLVHWEKQGAILKRDPSSPVLKHNVAMNWILRENGLRSPVS